MVLIDNRSHIISNSSGMWQLLEHTSQTKVPPEKDFHWGTVCSTEWPDCMVTIFVPDASIEFSILSQCLM